MNLIHTQSMCNVCFNKIPAEIYTKDDFIYLKKHCPNHGSSNNIIEKSNFFNEFPYITDTSKINKTFNTTVCMVFITENCNLKCTHCFYPNYKNKNVEIEDIIKTAKLSKSESFCLMGGEPTVHPNFFEIINQLSKEYKKPINIFSNGILLSNEEFCLQLKKYQINSINISLNHKNYISPDVYKTKLKAIENIKNINKINTSISSTITDLSELPDIIDEYNKLKIYPDVFFRIRLPGILGREFNNKEIYFSEFINEFKKICEYKNIKYKLLDNVYNNLYQCNFIFDNKALILTKSPSLDTIDLNSLISPFYSVLIPELGEIKSIPSYILKDAILNKQINICDLGTWKTI